MSGIGGHTIWPTELKFGAETPSHPQIAQPTSRCYTHNPGIRGPYKWGHWVRTAQMLYFCENFIKQKFKGTRNVVGTGQVRSDARPYPGVWREVEVLAIFKQSSKFLRFLRELTNVACRDQKVMGWKWSRCTPTLLDVHAHGDFQLRQKIWTTNATIWSPWGQWLQIKAFLGWDWWLHLPDELENESLTGQRRFYWDHWKIVMAKLSKLLICSHEEGVKWPLLYSSM